MNNNLCFFQYSLDQLKQSILDTKKIYLNSDIKNTNFKVYLDSLTTLFNNIEIKIIEIKNKTYNLDQCYSKDIDFVSMNLNRMILNILRINKNLNEISYSFILKLSKERDIAYTLEYILFILETIINFINNPKNKNYIDEIDYKIDEFNFECIELLKYINTNKF
jgi:hypothetical protein